MHTHPDLAMLLATEYRSRLTAEAAHTRQLSTARRARRARRSQRRPAGAGLPRSNR